jgi:hypothetical protein
MDGKFVPDKEKNKKKFILKQLRKNLHFAISLLGGLDGGRNWKLWWGV